MSKMCQRRTICSAAPLRPGVVGVAQERSYVGRASKTRPGRDACAHACGDLPSLLP